MYIGKTPDFSENLYALHAGKMSFNYKVYVPIEGMVDFVSSHSPCFEFWDRQQTVGSFLAKFRPPGALITVRQVPEAHSVHHHTRLSL